MNTLCKRIVNCNTAKTTILVDIHSNPVSPATEIESSLNGRLFFETLKNFAASYPNELSFIQRIDRDVDENSSHFSLDLRGSERESLDAFFNIDNHKYLFAQRYAENLSDQYAIPLWIQEVRRWLQ